ncbi:hypothetical protein [Saccharospirillum impatiens]|uniref:hypothetical protein n=1 Tax=Saccharospirillum impatiens TaxID=169438 RepID=UPI00048CC832|nr:hypothetical protein [Saccharospirillum impatiens]
MKEQSEELVVAEKYLKEMLKADDTANFDLYIKRFEEKYLSGFTQDVFRNDIKNMHEENGKHTGYEFLGSLRNQKIDDLDVHRTVWKGVYEKRDAVIEMGVYKKNGVWHVIRSAVY